MPPFCKQCFNGEQPNLQIQNLQYLQNVCQFTVLVSYMYKKENKPFCAHQKMAVFNFFRLYCLRATENFLTPCGTLK